jgi:hypothetical protein
MPTLSSLINRLDDNYKDNVIWLRQKDFRVITFKRFNSLGFTTQNLNLSQSCVGILYVLTLQLSIVAS